jgi:putative transposase
LATSFLVFPRAQLKRQGKLRGKVGYPKRKTRKRGLGGFRLTGTIVVFPDTIQLPRLGRLRLKERGYLPTSARILSATVTECADHWYVAVLVEEVHTVPINVGPIVGIDSGVRTLATLSDGTTESTPHHMRSCLKKLQRLQRTVSRKPKGSRNRKKAVNKLARLHRRVANQRANTLHQLTSRLAKTNLVVVIEDLNVVGMLRNHHLAQAIGDMGFGEFRRQLTYKGAWYGCQVIVVSRWEPTSKTCSNCGALKIEVRRAERVYRCDQCGLLIDRDLNAAINLAKLSGSSSDSQNACGGESAGRGHVALVNLSSLKQEPNTRYPLG